MISRHHFFAAVALVGFLTAVLQNLSSVPFASSSITPSDSELKNHEDMKQWLKTHPFKFKIPQALDRFFIKKMVVNPEGFILPPGQLWPYPAEWWTIRPSAWFTYLWDWYTYLAGFTKYSSHLILYRLTNTGFGDFYSFDLVQDILSIILIYFYLLSILH